MAISKKRGQDQRPLTAIPGCLFSQSAEAWGVRYQSDVSKCPSSRWSKPKNISSWRDLSFLKAWGGYDVNILLEQSVRAFVVSNEHWKKSLAKNKLLRFDRWVAKLFSNNYTEEKGITGYVKFIRIYNFLKHRKLKKWITLWNFVFIQRSMVKCPHPVTMQFSLFIHKSQGQAHTGCELHFAGLEWVLVCIHVLWLW